MYKLYLGFSRGDFDVTTALEPVTTLISTHVSANMRGTSHQSCTFLTNRKAGILLLYASCASPSLQQLRVRYDLRAGEEKRELPPDVQS